MIWDDPNARYYQHGLDHGALYLREDGILPWNGLTGLEESDAGSTSMYFRDGVIFLADADASDFKCQVTAMFYPELFGKRIGIPEATDGFFVDNQKPKPFDLSYRSLVGSGTKGDMFGYQLHLVYNCMATLETRSRRTITDSIETVEFTFDVVCTPVKLAGYRPSAHYVIDTRFISASKMADIEDMLYGTEMLHPTLPDPNDFFDLLNYGDAIAVTSYSNGTFDVEGSNANVYMLDDDHFQINDVNSTFPDVNGHYTISTGGSTTVVDG